MKLRQSMRSVRGLLGRSGEVGAAMESLESRQLLAAVFWDGGAGTTSWHDAANWDRGGVNAVPMNGDDVTIMAAGTPTITFTAGTVTLASLVTDDAITISAGTLELQAGGTADINAAFAMQGGTIGGGSWDVTGGVLRGTASGGIIANAAITGDILLDTTSASVRVSGTTRFTAARLSATSATLQCSPGYTLLDTVVVEGAATGSRFVTGAVGGTGTLTVAPSGVIRVAAGAGGNLAVNNSSVLTLVNNGLITVEAAGRTLTFNNTTVTNSATIQALAGTLDISPTTFTNAAGGMVTAGNGTTLAFSGAWSNTGVISVNGATLNLGGTFTLALAGTLSRTGGTVNLTGTLNNAGSTLAFSAATGSWNLAGGTVAGGAVTFSGGNRLVLTSSGGVLTDAQVAGELLLDTSSASVRVSGTTRFTAARLTAGSVTLQAAPGYTLLDTVVAEGAATGARSVTGAVGSAGTLTIGPTGVIRLAAGSGGNLVVNNSSVLTLVNDGLISAEAAGRTLTFNNTTVTNNAVMQVTMGTMDVSPPTFTNTATGVVMAASGSTLNIGGNWSSAGTITQTGATLNLGGTFSFAASGMITRTGGTVNLTGTMNNTGSTITFDAARGAWNLLGGSITGGTVVFSGANRLALTSSGGVLTDVQVMGELLLDTSSAIVRVAGTTRFTAARLTAGSVTLQAAPGYTLFDTVVAEGAATGVRSVTGAVGSAGTLTIGPTGVIRLAAGSGGNLTVSNSSTATVINNGLVSAEATGRTLAFNNTTVTNNAVMQALAGTLNVSPTNFTNGAAGVLSGAAGSTVSVSGNWANAGAITVTSATLNLGGTFTLSAAGMITRVGGTVNLTGTLNNAGETLAFNAATGAWNLLGGTVNGGTIVFSGTDRLVMTTSGGGLSDVQVNGELLLDVSSASVRVSGTTRFEAARLSAGSTTLQCAPGYTLLDLVVVEGAAVGARSITGAVGAPGTLTIGPTGVVRLAAGAGGNLSVSNSSQATVVNNGLVVVEAAGRTLTFNNTTVTNNAMLRAMSGTLNISPTTFTNAAGGTVFGASGTSVAISAAWSNAGTIEIVDATLNLGGTFATAGIGTINRTGGQVQLSGTLDNAGGTLTFTPTTGSWNLLGGTINGGTIVPGATDRLTPTTSGGTLHDVQVNGELVLDGASTSIRIGGATRFGAARLIGASSGVQFSPGYVLHDLVVAEGPSAGARGVTAAVGATGTFTVSPSGVIRLAAGAGGGLSLSNSSQVTFTNEGTVAAEANGRTLSISFTAVTNVNAEGDTLTGGTWIATGTSALTLPGSPVITTNNANVTVGGSTQVNGATSFPALATLSTNNGSLSTRGGGTFTITPAGGTLVNTGAMTLGAGNVLAVSGDFTMAAAATMTVQVRGTAPTDIGRLSVSGTATLAGGLTVSPVDGWAPTCVNSVFITAGTLVDQFATQSLPTAPQPLTSFVVYLGEVRFAISPPSDYNRDGFLNSQDFFDFLSALFELDPASDFNHDGFINSQDFFDFISDFFRGC